AGEVMAGWVDGQAEVVEERDRLQQCPARAGQPVDLRQAVEEREGEVRDVPGMGQIDAVARAELGDADPGTVTSIDRPIRGRHRLLRSSAALSGTGRSMRPGRGGTFTQDLRYRHP